MVATTDDAPAARNPRVNPMTPSPMIGPSAVRQPLSTMRSAIEIEIVGFIRRQTAVGHGIAPMRPSAAGSPASARYDDSRSSFWTMPWVAKWSIDLPARLCAHAASVASGPVSTVGAEARQQVRDGLDLTSRPRQRRQRQDAVTDRVRTRIADEQGRRRACGCDARDMYDSAPIAGT